MTNSTITKLRDMKLNGMADALREQCMDASYKKYSFEERFLMLVDAEWDKRKNNKYRRLVSEAHFKYNGADIVDVDYHQDRNLDRSLIMHLARCTYIQESENIILIGASGCGKTWLSCALGMAACKKYISVIYIRLPELLEELAVARSEKMLQKVINKYVRVKLLIIDEWLLTPISEDEAKGLFEIIERRELKASTIFCSQFKPQGWHERIEQATLSDAILDRIMHNAHKIHIGGKKSMREKKGVKKLD